MLACAAGLASCRLGVPVEIRRREFLALGVIEHVARTIRLEEAATEPV